jgi:carbon monoxide dehydrogenase subunit G
MGTVEQSIDVDVPLSTVYNQWTQFESFPQFMEGVEEIRQIDDTHMHWRTKIAGITREFDAEITEQRPDERVAWRSTDGNQHAGVVTFHRLGDTQTRIMVQLDEQPDGVVDKVGDALGILKRRVKGDLERFKTMIEERGSETGAWRGEVKRPDERADEGGASGRFTRAAAPDDEAAGQTSAAAGATAGRTAPPDADLGAGGTDPGLGVPGPAPIREQGGL